jgi:hypothetical protein
MAGETSNRPTGQTIDVRRHREGRLRAGQTSSLSWTRGGEPSGGIYVLAVADAVILMFHSQRQGHTEGKPFLQRVPIHLDCLPPRRPPLVGTDSGATVFGTGGVVVGSGGIAVSAQRGAA